jgi:hypothetical protein
VGGLETGFLLQELALFDVTPHKKPGFFGLFGLRGRSQTGITYISPLSQQSSAAVYTPRKSATSPVKPWPNFGLSRRVYNRR